MENVNGNYWDSFVDIDEAKGYDKTPRFRLKEKGASARIAFPLVNPNTGKVALRAVTYFDWRDINDSSKFARFEAPADKNSKAYKVAFQHCGEPATTYVTPILVYPTSDKGRVLSSTEYELTNLTLAPRRLRSLQQVQDDNDLSKVDLRIVCDEPKFQAMSFHILHGCGYRDGKIAQKDQNGSLVDFPININPKQVMDEAIAMSYECSRAVANQWSEDQILAFFNKSENTPQYDDEPETAAPTELANEVSDEDWNEFG